ncbi:hypothetical protein [Microcoleus vaginatus]|uniref:hypothetical protein n=1 Tax=Microcoleus vaginatus TaxID=119532 RepID=UPI001685AB71|nr:hypothetical protein [Microcoleus sp. FACHB-84]MBD2010922.1 hypothetical protein [Microcoleus sp. FACHB-45]
MKIFSAIDHPQVKINLNSKKGNSRRSPKFRRRYKPKGRSTAVHFPRLTHQPGSYPKKYRVSRSQTVKKPGILSCKTYAFMLVLQP